MEKTHKRLYTGKDSKVYKDVLYAFPIVGKSISYGCKTMGCRFTINLLFLI